MSEPDDDCCNLTVTGRPAKLPSVRRIDRLRFTICYLCHKEITHAPRIASFAGSRRRASS